MTSSIGQRRHLVTFESAVDTVDDTSGEPIRTWTTVGEAWAKIRRLRAREGEIAGGVEDEVDTEIETGFSMALAALRAKDRAVHDGVYYNLHAPPDRFREGNKRRLLFTASSGLNPG